MPTVTIDRDDVTQDEVVSALQNQLGSRYTVEARQHGTRELVSVKQSTLAFGSVHLVHEGSTTKLHVHGGGLLIGRLVNELTLARKVATALKAEPGLAGSS